MKDFLGKDIKVGDAVIWSSGITSPHLSIVTKLLPATIRLDTGSMIPYRAATVITEMLEASHEGALLLERHRKSCCKKFEYGAPKPKALKLFCGILLCEDDLVYICEERALSPNEALERVKKRLPGSIRTGFRWVPVRPNQPSGLLVSTSYDLMKLPKKVLISLDMDRFSNGIGIAKEEFLNSASLRPDLFDARIGISSSWGPTFLDKVMTK